MLNNFCLNVFNKLSTVAKKKSENCETLCFLPFSGPKMGKKLFCKNRAS